MGPIRPTPDHERGAGVNLPDEVDVLVAGFGAGGCGRGDRSPRRRRVGRHR